MLSGPQHFSCKFSHKIALVRCPRAFRLRRLAQSLRREFFEFFGCGIFRVNGSCEMSKAFRLRRLARSVRLSFGPRIFPVSARIKLLL